MGVLVLLDVEGPQVLNDNAFELTEALAGKCGLGEETGANFFKRMSVIDDIWGDFHKIPQDPSYSSGHTLKVVLPFYKAMLRMGNINPAWLYDFSKDSVRIVPDIKETLEYLMKNHMVWMISTSYDVFIKAFVDQMGFPFRQTFCTKLQGFNEVAVSIDEATRMVNFMEYVAKTPIIEYNTKTGEVSEDCQREYKLITEFVWHEVYEMEVSRLLREIRPVGQAQKMESAQEILRATKVNPSKTLYCGDSQTDVKAVEHVGGNGGLTLMFNGKGPVCEKSDLMYVGESALIIAKVIDMFDKKMKEETLALWDPPQKIYQGILGTVTPASFDELYAMSVKKRKEFRGVKIGELT